MFSMDNLVLQLGYALLVGALLARTTRQMRMLIAVAAIAMLANAILRADHVAAGLMLVLLAIWLVRLWGDRRKDRKIRFTPMEEVMRRTYLRTLPRDAAREFIDLGLWLRGRANDVLTSEGEPIANLYYLVSGEARATIQAREVGIWRTGDLIGEATILSGDDATATVTLIGPCTFWCVSTPTLRRFLNNHEGLRSAMERNFSTAVRDKLHTANLVTARAGYPA